VIVLSIYSLVRWKAGLAQTRYLASPQSGGGLLTFAVLGFVIGAVLVGTAASPLITNLLASGGQGADVHIVPNAMTVPTPFTPRNLNVGVNTTVRWYNGDTNQHTVTCDTGVFASPLLDSGGWFSFKFTQKGTFPYHCEPHPNMTWTIVVT
jgi:plastocyanin